MRVVVVEAIYTLVILEPGLCFLGKKRRKGGERKNHLQLLSMILLLMMRL